MEKKFLMAMLFLGMTAMSSLGVNAVDADACSEQCKRHKSAEDKKGCWKDCMYDPDAPTQ